MHLQHCLAKACSTGTTSGWMRPDPCIKQADRARVCLALTCGLPGAGKTSVCKAILASSKSDVLVRHICFDDTIEVDPSEDVSRDMTNATTFKVIKMTQICNLTMTMPHGTAMTQWVCRRLAGSRLNN